MPFIIPHLSSCTCPCIGWNLRRHRFSTGTRYAYRFTSHRQMKAICKDIALMSSGCPSAPTLKRDQLYILFFIRPHEGPRQGAFFPTFPPTTLVFQWFGVPTTRSTQTRISPSKMYESRTTAVRYRKRNTTLKCRPRLKK